MTAVAACNYMTAVVINYHDRSDGLYMAAVEITMTAVAAGT